MQATLKFGLTGQVVIAHALLYTPKNKHNTYIQRQKDNMPIFFTCAYLPFSYSVCCKAHVHY